VYQYITQNKRRTWFLLFGMSLFIVALSFAFGAANGVDGGSSVVFGIIVATVYGLISYYASMRVALYTSGAKEISKKDAPELWNLVENLCIANGQPMPGVYIIEDPSPNAFATGRDPEHSAIVFTTGLLQLLNKQELEGVAAHELSHIKNYDIRVMTITVVLVGAIALLADIFLRSGSRSDSSKNNNGVLILIGIVLAILAPIVSEVIKLAISRQREYLADASGALLTRYPDGLASALQKLQSANIPLKNANRATAHLYISSPFAAGGYLSRMFSTHPPTEDRVARLRSMSL
jgi:heat shock protein HtpX